MNVKTIITLLTHWEQQNGFDHHCMRCRRSSRLLPFQEIFRCRYCEKETHIRQILNHELMIEQLREKKPHIKSYQDFEPTTMNIKEISGHISAMTLNDEITFTCKTCHKHLTIKPTQTSKVCPKCMYRNTAPNAAISIIKEYTP